MCVAFTKREYNISKHMLLHVPLNKEVCVQCLSTGIGKRILRLRRLNN